MRAQTLVICGALSLGATACGSSSHTAASVASPPSRVSVSALIAPGRIAIDPSRLGAGPITLTVTNQASRAEELVISRSGSSRAVAHTGRIGPQGTTQIVLDLTRGNYAVTAAVGGAHTDAQRARQTGRPGTSLRIGKSRRGSGSALLVP
jgi:hypothetical protein